MTIKTFALALATVAATATTASAAGFSFGQTLQDSATVDLGLVNAPAAGVVEIYNYTGGERGALLGTQIVAEGANQSVRIDVGHGFKTDVLAVLKVGDEIIAEKDYDIVR